MRGVIRIAVVIGLALTATGCDKCGNWFKYTPKACGAEPLK